jgi:hypothetical protein
VPAPLGAILLCDENLSADEHNLVVLLDFFGIPWKTAKTTEMLASTEDGRFSRYCILSSASRMATALDTIAVPEAGLPSWLSKANSVYIYDFEETAPCRKLLRYLSGTVDGEILRPIVPEARLTVTDDFPEMCGPMSGLQLPAKQTEIDNCFDVRLREWEHQSIISADCGHKFLSVKRDGVRFFLNASHGIIDISAPATKYFEVKDNFCRAVPIVMYLKWAFAGICWGGVAETWGCLIVDDPILKARYGFLSFSEALELMDTHNFTTAIAFIPWNWKRTKRRTVQQFKSRADKLSLCVHGCDHSGGEFAARSSALLNRRIKTARQRMESLSQRTSLVYDNIMVFPQGMFSPEAGRALKLNGMVAAANTEVAPSGGAPNETTIADLWDVAIMKYGTFPIFTRRYLTHGVENFAFDALLGKPCLIVAHHEVFKDRGRELAEFIAKLNSLKWNLRWCSLGEVIRHCFKIRRCVEGTCAIQMYAQHLVIENTFPVPIEAVVMKEEGEPNCVEAVEVNQKVIQHSYENRQLKFKITISPGERVETRVTYLDKLDLDSGKDDVAYRLKTGVRRHLSEFRDDYISRSDFLYAMAAKVKRLLN